MRLEIVTRPDMAPSEGLRRSLTPAIPPTVAEVPKELLHSFPHTKRVGNYLLGRTLGEGSFAKVKEGLHTLTGEKVAVKMIDKNKAKSDAYVRKNLRREGKLLQLVRHKNVIQLYEVMETENSYYLVTDLCTGGDLMEQICQKAKLEEKEVRKYIRQVISAVDYLHKLGIIHRDLKIENLLFDESKDIKIIDFGLSNAVRVSHTKNGGRMPQEFCVTQCGSPAYAAPELLGSRKYGPKVDIWSIGVIMYAMLAGNLPFTVEPFSIKSLYSKMLKGDMNAIPEYVSKTGRDFLKKLLTPEPDKRMTMQEAMKHPWLMEGLTRNRILEPAPFPNHIRPDDLDQNILKHMSQELDFRVGDTIRLVTNNFPNNATATYHLLKRKLDRFEAQMRVKGKVAASNNIHSHRNLQSLTKRVIPNEIITLTSVPMTTPRRRPNDANSPSPVSKITSRQGPNDVISPSPVSKATSRQRPNGVISPSPLSKITSQKGPNDVISPSPVSKATSRQRPNGVISPSPLSKTTSRRGREKRIISRDGNENDPTYSHGSKKEAFRNAVEQASTDKEGHSTNTEQPPRSDPSWHNVETHKLDEFNINNEVFQTKPRTVPDEPSQDIVKEKGTSDSCSNTEENKPDTDKTTNVDVSGADDASKSDTYLVDAVATNATSTRTNELPTIIPNRTITNKVASKYVKPASQESCRDNSSRENGQNEGPIKLSQTNRNTTTPGQRSLPQTAGTEISSSSSSTNGRRTIHSIMTRHLDRFSTQSSDSSPEPTSKLDHTTGTKPIRNHGASRKLTFDIKYCNYSRNHSRKQRYSLDQPPANCRKAASIGYPGFNRARYLSDRQQWIPGKSVEARHPGLNITGAKAAVGLNKTTGELQTFQLDNSPHLLPGRKSPGVYAKTKILALHHLNHKGGAYSQKNEANCTKSASAKDVHVALPPLSPQPVNITSIPKV